MKPFANTLLCVMHLFIGKEIPKKKKLKNTDKSSTFQLSVCSDILYWPGTKSSRQSLKMAIGINSVCTDC